MSSQPVLPQCTGEGQLLRVLQLARAGPLVYGLWTSKWSQGPIQTRSIPGSLMVTWATAIIQTPYCYQTQIQTQTWLSVSAWASASPWPQVTSKAIHVRLFLTTRESLVSPFFTGHTLFCFSFFSVLHHLLWHHHVSQGPWVSPESH